MMLSSLWRDHHAAPVPGRAAETVGLTVVGGYRSDGKQIALSDMRHLNIIFKLVSLRPPPKNGFLMRNFFNFGTIKVPKRSRGSFLTPPDDHFWDSFPASKPPLIPVSIPVPNDHPVPLVQCGRCGCAGGGMRFCDARPAAWRIPVGAVLVGCRVEKFFYFF